MLSKLYGLLRMLEGFLLEICDTILKEMHRSIFIEKVKRLSKHLPLPIKII